MLLARCKGAPDDDDVEEEANNGKEISEEGADRGIRRDDNGGGGAKGYMNASKFGGAVGSAPGSSGCSKPRTFRKK